MSWQPQAKTRQILDYAWGHVQAVSYRLGVRSICYRLLQEGILRSKADFRRAEYAMREARRHQWGPWRLDTLEDSTRWSSFGGGGSSSAAAWRESLRCAECHLDQWQVQPVYIELFIESRGVRGQFEYYAREFTLSPLGGDPSFDFIASIAHRFSTVLQRGQVIEVYHFGDRDKEGEELADTAVEAIRRASGVDFNYTRIGLTQTQAEAMGLPQNPYANNPDEYQWEALTDGQASSLILPVVNLIDRDAWERVETEELEETARFREVLHGASW